MNKYYFLLFILLISCDTSDSVVNSDERPIVKISVFDNSDKPIGRSFVNVYQNINDRRYGVFSDSSDEYGRVDLGRVLEGNYSIYCTFKKDNIVYSDWKEFQAVNNSNKQINLYPLKNIGNFSIVVQNMKGQRISGINVAFLNHGHYLPDRIPASYNDLIKDAYWIKKTNSEGLVEFENAPKGFTFSALIFWDSLRFEYPNMSFSVDSKGPQLYNVDL